MVYNLVIFQILVQLVSSADCAGALDVTDDLQHLLVYSLTVDDLLNLVTLKLHISVLIIDWFYMIWLLDSWHWLYSFVLCLFLNFKVIRGKNLFVFVVLKLCCITHRCYGTESINWWRDFCISIFCRNVCCGWNFSFLFWCVCTKYQWS